MPPFSQLFPSLPPSITGKPVASAPFRFPQNSSTPAPNATSTTTKKPTYIPPPAMGQKAAQPGGLVTAKTNTLPKPFVAKPSDQNATGGVPPSPVPSQTDALARNGLTPTSTPNVFTATPPTGGSTGGAGSSTGTLTSAPLGSFTADSISPPTSTIPAGTLGTGSPTDLGATQTPQGLMGNLIAQANANYQKQQAALQPSVQANQDIINKATAEEEQLTAGSFSGTAADYSGRVAQLENIKQAAQGNINSALGNINNALTPSQNAFGTALGAVTNFQQSPYGTPLFNPATGQVVSGGQQISSTGNTATGAATGGGVSPSDPFYQTMQQYAQMAAKGQLSAVPSSITSNPILNAQLNQMAKQINPSFNPVLSTGSAQTQQTGQQASAAAPAAYQALDSLQTAYNNLDELTGATQVPLLNQLEQSVQLNTNLFGGRATVSAFQGALKEARAQVDAVLAPIIGVDAASLQANALLPDNMLKDEIPQKIQAAKNYIAQRIQSYVGSGAQAGTVPQTGSQSTSTLDYSDAHFYGQH